MKKKMRKMMKQMKIVCIKMIVYEYDVCYNKTCDDEINNKMINEINKNNMMKTMMMSIYNDENNIKSSMMMLLMLMFRVAIGSDRKQFFPSDPTKNKNESDPIRRKI